MDDLDIDVKLKDLVDIRYNKFNPDEYNRSIKDIRCEIGSKYLHQSFFTIDKVLRAPIVHIGDFVVPENGSDVIISVYTTCFIKTIKPYIRFCKQNDFLLIIDKFYKFNDEYYVKIFINISDHFTEINLHKHIKELATSK